MSSSRTLLCGWMTFVESWRRWRTHRSTLGGFEPSKWRNSPKKWVGKHVMSNFICFFLLSNTLFFSTLDSKMKLLLIKIGGGIYQRNTQSKNQTSGLDMFSPANIEEFVSSIGLSDAKKLTDQSLSGSSKRWTCPSSNGFQRVDSTLFQPADYPTKARMSPPILPGLV